jgi:hypothetical protein
MFHFVVLTGSDDRLEDFYVAGAAAQVSGETSANVGFGRLRCVFKQTDSGDDHAGRADAALCAAAL